MQRTDAPGFDVIGDVHGHVEKLVELLTRMGYGDESGVWRHPLRQAVFVGDLIDRGPQQLEVLRLVRPMVDSGSALIVAGNHEFNAIAYHTPDAANPGAYLRRHSDKNRSQHQEFLDAVGEGSDEHADWVSWFSSFPLWLDLDGLRVVHACWDGEAIAALRPWVDEADAFTPELIVEASVKGSAAWQAVEHLLKGPELAVPVPYLDKDGHVRDKARFRWWDPDADRLSRAALVPPDAKTADGEPCPPLPDEDVFVPVDPYRDEVPVVFGHYWRTGPTKLLSSHATCVDYSAANGGPLVAYRWSGEAALDLGNFEKSR